MYYAPVVHFHPQNNNFQVALMPAILALNSTDTVFDTLSNAQVI